MPTVDECLAVIGQLFTGPFRTWLLGAVGLAFLGGVVGRFLWGGRS